MSTEEPIPLFNSEAFNRVVAQLGTADAIASAARRRLEAHREGVLLAQEGKDPFLLAGPGDASRARGEAARQPLPDPEELASIQSVVEAYYCEVRRAHQ